MISKKQFGVVTFIVVVITAILTWSINNFVVYGVTDETTGKFRVVTGILQRKSFYDVDDVTLQNGSIQGMVSSLDDPDCLYLTAEELAEYENNFSAEYTGIGIRTTKIISGYMVVEVAGKSPAADAGVKVNDVVIGINGKDVTASEESIADLLSKNKPLTSLKVTRNGEELSVDITTATADFTSTISQIHEVDGKNIQVFDLQQFTDKTVSLLEADLKKLATSDTQGVIFDLRNNTGGSVEVAKQILEKTVSNKEDFLYLQNKENDELKDWEKFKSTNSELTIKQPMLILVNEKTASAAEMVAAALNQIDGVPIVGTATYGKGTVQEIVPIVNDGSAIVLTTKKWYTPNKINLTIEESLSPTEAAVDSLPFTIFTIGATKEYVNGDRDVASKTTIANTQMLLGYFGYDTKRTDGLFDDKTEEEIKRFQADNNITITGKIDQNTLYVLNTKLIEYTQDINHDETLQKALHKLTNM